MKIKTGLTTQNIEDIKDVLSCYPNIREVLIYGSRALGTYKPASDIDLSLFGVNIDTYLLSQLEADLDDLLLPYKFDISIYSKISNSDFKEHIDKFGVEFYKRIID